MKIEKDVEDLNLDFSDRSIDKPKALKNLVYEFHLNGDSSGASSLESLDFGYDDGYIFDHQLEFPAVHIEVEKELKSGTVDDGYIFDHQLEFPATHVESEKEPECGTATENDESVTAKCPEENEAKIEVTEAPTIESGTDEDVSLTVLYATYGTISTFLYEP